MHNILPTQFFLRPPPYISTENALHTLVRSDEYHNRSLENMPYHTFEARLVDGYIGIGCSEEDADYLKTVLYRYLLQKLAGFWRN